MTQAKPMETTPEEGAVLHLTRRLKASREDVFDAFTNVDIFKQWWGPKSVSCRAAEIDPRPGGRFHAEMLTAEGNTHVIEGLFREVTAPSRLVFTWAWQHGDYKHLETLVTLEFHESGGTTELVLTHEKLADERSRELHGEGWTGCLDCLDEHLSKGPPQ